MRLTALFPLAFTVGALVLCFLCIFAGHKRNFMEDFDIVTVNTSRIGFEYFNVSLSASSDPSSVPSWLQPLTNWINTAANDLESVLEDALNSEVESIAKDLGLHDWYSIHVLDFCEGFYSPAGSRSENVTSCSKPHALFAFNLTQTLNDELAAADIPITLTNIAYPADITEGLQALNTTWKAMFITYTIGTALTGLALLATAVGVVAAGRGVAWLNLVLAGLAVVVLIPASSLVTYGGSKAVDVLNSRGQVVDINASRGAKFLALTWSATALMMLAFAAWTVEVCTARRRDSRHGLRKYDTDAERKEVE